MQMTEFLSKLSMNLVDPMYSAEILDYFLRNKLHFSNSMPIIPNNFFTLEYQIKKAVREEELANSGKHFRNYITIKSTGQIIGDIAISNIIRESVSSCQIGYKIDKEYLRRGLMYHFLQKVIKFVFDELKLKRIEANVLPENIPSLKLLHKLNFREEGVAYSLAKINGEWKDHLRFSLIKEGKN